MPRSQIRRAPLERAHACDGLLAVGPDADTLCEGWTAHDLAAHLWIRENELLNSSGAFIPALHDRLQARTDELKRQWPFEELVERFRQGPPRRSLFALPGADEAANDTELLIHGMDVRRPNGLPEPDRDPDFQPWAWSKLSRVASFLVRGNPVPIVLEWRGRPDHALRIGKGNRIVTVIGEPSELLLYAFGRRAAADVRLVGLESAVAEALGRDPRR